MKKITKLIIFSAAVSIGGFTGHYFIKDSSLMSVWWNSTLLTVGYVCCLTQGPESEIFKKDKDE